VNREDVRFMIETALLDANDTRQVNVIDDSTFGIVLYTGQRVIVGVDIEIVDQQQP
jgi:hypothetical protein